jgi:predicted metal-dependent hydrolase
MIEKKDVILGETIYFHSNGKLTKAVVLKKNPKTVLVQVRKKKYRVTYEIIFKNNEINAPFPYFNLTSYDSDEDLYHLVEELRKEYAYVFDTYSDEQKALLNTVRVKWNSRITYRLGGKYFKTNKHGEIRNEIMISSSLKKTPKYLIKFLLYHEMLHIKILNHSKEFRYYERKFIDYDIAQDLFHKILLEIRFYGKERLLKYIDS